MNESPIRLAEIKCDRPAPEIHDAGKMANPWRYCDALRWAGGIARTSICCIAGKVHVQEIQEPPGPLLSLIRGEHGDSEEFRANLREYNALMSCASFGEDLDLEMAQRPGCYVYRIRGSIYHRIG